MSKSYRQHFSWPTNLIDSVNGNYGFAELCIDPPLRLRIKLEFLQRPQIGRRWPRRRCMACVQKGLRGRLPVLRGHEARSSIGLLPMGGYDANYMASTAA